MTLMIPRFSLLEQKDIYCVGFQNGALQSKDGKDIVLMGGQHCTAVANPFCFKCCVFYASVCFLLDLVLSNKLVVYDLENQVIGWTDYNCKFKPSHS